MSDIKVNGDTYKDVTSIRFMKSDDSGYATYTEGAVADSYLDRMLFGNYGDVYDDRSGTVHIGFLSFGEGGTINLPNVTVLKGACRGGVYENLLFPKAASLQYRATAPAVSSNFYQTTVSGVLDLSGIVPEKIGNNALFSSATIGTLKLGAVAPHNNMFMSATVTNLVWNNTDTTADKMGSSNGLRSSGARITNAYVPDAFYDDIKALMDAGTLTTVTNLYKLSEWSDD